MENPESRRDANPVQPHTLDEWTAMRFNLASECYNYFKHGTSHGIEDQEDGLPAFLQRDENDPELIWTNNVHGYPKYPDGSHRMYLTERDNDGKLKLTRDYAATLPRTGFASE